MSPSPRNLIIVACLAAISLAAPGRAELLWNAYNDFYLSPTAAGWGGATSPSSAGQAWGYYMGNVNGVGGYPFNVGSYLTSGQIYKFTSSNPAGASDSNVYGQTLFDATGGRGFGRYVDTIGYAASLGSYTTPWFGGAPGLSQGLTNLMWLQSGYLNNTNSSPIGPAEGIASVLTWKAPSAGVYNFSGLFVSGDQAANSAAVAIVSPGGANLSRTVLANNSVQSFSFQSSYNAGDVVQFQVGNNFSVGNAVGLQLQVTAVPEPSTIFAALALVGLLLARCYSRRNADKKVA